MNNDRQVCRWEEEITMDLPNAKLPSIDAAKEYVDRLWAQHARWYRPIYNSAPSVELATGDRLLHMQRDDHIAWAGIGHKGHRIVLRAEGMYPLDCIHEVAHLLAPKRGHDEGFVAVLDILETQFDAFDPEYARESAPGYGVRMLPYTYSESGRPADAHLLVHGRYQ